MQEQKQEKKNDSNTQENKKTKRNIEPKQALDDKKLKQIINVEYSKANNNYKIVQQAVNNITEKLKKPIVDIIGFADASLELVIKEEIDKTGNVKKKYEMNFNLTDEELNFLAIKIPTACIYVQEYINQRALDVSIAEYMLQDTITENLKSMEGGDAKERLRFAEQKAEIEQIVSIVKKQVYVNLKSYIDRADKIYEGVKKVLDGRNNEKKLFGKSNQFSA